MRNMEQHSCLTSQPVVSLALWHLALCACWWCLVDAVQCVLSEGLNVPGAIKLGHEAIAAGVGEPDGALDIILPHIQLCRG